MSEKPLTRDEIRKACEAVGWQWNERQKPPGEELEMAHFDFAREVHEHPSGERVARFRFHPTSRTTNEDALALLQAWCNEHPDREVQLFINRDKPGLILIPEEGMDYGIPMDGPLKTAAVRAVNQWAKTR